MINRTRVCLRIFGDDLVPEEISRVLGATPSEVCKKGEVLSRPQGRDVVARTGSWRLRVEDRSPGDLDGQIKELLSLTTADALVWQTLYKRYRCDVFCGLFLHDVNEGADLDPETMAMLAVRGLRLELDIYGLDRDRHMARRSSPCQTAAETATDAGRS